MKQIVIQPQAVGFCRFHQRIDDCTRLRPLGRIGKELSLPANDKRTDGVFNLVVADFNFTMLKKRAEVRFLILNICSSVLQLACRTENCNVLENTCYCVQKRVQMNRSWDENAVRTRLYYF